MTDYLSKLPPKQVADWYHRLADSVSKNKINGQEPLSAIFLRTWLNNRNPKYTLVFQPPLYLRLSNYVMNVLKFHRAVFLTEQKARFTGGRKAWAGILPRFQGLPGFTQWNLQNDLAMEYESLVEVGNGLVDIIRIQNNGTPAERDLLTSLRGFQQKSQVVVKGTALANGKINIQFKSWQCEINDTYDFNYNEYFTPPNPDFGRHDLKEAVQPEIRSFRVYHKNAKRLEDNNLACPYKIKSYPWNLNAPNITSPAEIDPAKKLI
jgi:hypothetical protein